MSTFVKQAGMAVDHARLGRDRLAHAAREHRLQDVRRDGRDARARLRPRLPQASRAGRDDHRAGRDRSSSGSSEREDDSRGRRLRLPRQGRRARLVQRRRRDGAPVGRARPARRRRGLPARRRARARSPGPRCAERHRRAAPHRAPRLRRRRAGEHASRRSRPRSSAARTCSRSTCAAGATGCSSRTTTAPTRPARRCWPTCSRWRLPRASSSTWISRRAASSAQLIGLVRDAGLPGRVTCTGGNWAMLAGIHRAEPGIRAGLTMPRRRPVAARLRPAAAPVVRAGARRACWPSTTPSSCPAPPAREPAARPPPARGRGRDLGLDGRPARGDRRGCDAIGVDGICSDDPVSHGWGDAAERDVVRRWRVEADRSGAGRSPRRCGASASPRARRTASTARPARRRARSGSRAVRARRPSRARPRAAARRSRRRARSGARRRALPPPPRGRWAARRPSRSARRASSSSTACSARRASACSRRLATTGRMSGSSAFACSTVKSRVGVGSSATKPGIVPAPAAEPALVAPEVDADDLLGALALGPGRVGAPHADERVGEGIAERLADARRRLEVRDLLLDVLREPPHAAPPRAARASSRPDPR